MSYAPRHRKVEPNALVSAVAGRHGKALTGIAIAVPTVVAGVGMAAPANAAPALAPQTTSAAVPQAAAATAAPALASYTTNVVVLRYGSTGSLVVTLQKRLGISADGSFGPGTLASVKAFQGRKGLVRDGYVGPATWNALGGYPGGTASRSTGSTSRGSSAANIAYRYVGIPYVYGGSTPSSGFDCSGLTSYIYRQVGVSLQRSARAQQAAARRVSSPIPGDLVFYGYPAYHVGIYIGGGRMIAAPKPGERVKVQAVYGPALNNYGRPY